MEQSFYNDEEGKFTDKNGRFIKLGDKAVVTDRDGKKWYGKIVKQDTPTILESKKIYRYSNYLAFHSNYDITLWQYWTSKKLEILKKTSRYEFISK